MRLTTIALAATLLFAGCSRGPLHFDGEPRPIFENVGVRTSERVAFSSTENGNLYVLGVDGEKKKLVMMMSHDGGDNFMLPIPVSPDGVNVQYRSENGPSLVASGMNVYALWQQSTPEAGTEVVVARQGRMGEGFATPVRVLDKKPDDRSFNGFSSMALGPKGEIYVVWLDGRDQAPPQGTFSLYLAKSSDQGKTFGKNIRIVTSVCPCCRPSIAVDDDGNVYVAWRKVFDGDIRDIVVASSRDGGNTFSGPVKAADDSWVLHACPDSGPSLAVRNGKVAIAWFSEGRGKSGIRYATSSDQGKTFGGPQMISSSVVDPNHPALAINGDGATIIAFQGRDEKSQNGWGAFATYAVKIDKDGKASAAQRIPGGDSSSYPAVRLPREGAAVIGWTRGHEEKASVVMVRARL
jgi:hypothetical protein